MTTNLFSDRERRRALGRSLVIALTAAFYLAIVPVAVVLSGPVYRALSCTFGDCEDPGTEVVFLLPTRGALRIGSTIRLPNGDEVGTVRGFRSTGDERYTALVGRIDPDAESLLQQPLRCEASANFNLQMDADLVLSTCPGLELPPPTGPDDLFVCGAIDHFQAMGQQLRHFVLENVRPGSHPQAARLSGPCGADNEAATSALRNLLASP